MNHITGVADPQSTSWLLAGGVCQLPLTVLPQSLPQTVLKSTAEAPRVTSHCSAVQSTMTISPWQEHGMRQWQGRNKTHSCCKDIPRASASHNASQSGSPPSDSCPHTSTAGTRLCRKGSHISPLRGTLLNAKRYSRLDLRNGIHLSSLISRFLAHSLCSAQEPQQFGLATPEQQWSHEGQKGF